MLSTDARNQTWEKISALLSGRRLAVYEAWLRFGPGTTQEVAERSGIGLLTLRPRTTELLQLGYLVATGIVDGHGTYRALDTEAALAAYHARQQEQRAEAAQLPLRLPQ